MSGRLKCVRSEYKWWDSASGRIKTSYTFELYDVTVKPWFLVDRVTWDYPVVPESFKREMAMPICERR